MRPVRTLSMPKVDKARVLRNAAFAALLLAPAEARARESAALHDAPDSDEDQAMEEEAFGTRGLVRTRAETVSFDAREHSVELAGDVRVDSPPFHLRSERIKLTRTRYGIEADGKGTLAFCPCLGTPVKIEFDKAIVAPPGELILRSPKLEIYGVPVLYLPWFWLRSDEKVGLLPPDVAYRGQDGVYVGGGVHLPWKDAAGKRALDLRGGAYLNGGFVADARLRSPSSEARVRYDRLPGSSAPMLAEPSSRARGTDDGLFVDARGRRRTELTAAAWDVDLVRGRRGLAATTDLDAASKPWDRAAASTWVHLGPLTAETGVRAVTRRGGDLVAVEAWGPFATLRSSGAVSAGVTYDVTVEGGALRLAGPAASLGAPAGSPAPPPDHVTDTLSYVRADAGATGTTTVGPFEASLALRGAGDAGAEGRRAGHDRAGGARLRVGMPLARTFSSDARSLDDAALGGPLVHVVDPFVAAAVMHARGDAILGSLPGRGLASISGTAPIVEAGIVSALGRWGARDALELTAAGGAAGAPSVRPLARARLAGTTRWLGTHVETAHVFGERTRGSALVGRARLGRADGLRLTASVAVREGIDPVLARALTDPTMEPTGGFIAREGTTGGTALVIPWANAVTTTTGADADLTSGELVAARAGVELRDRCRCVTIRANGSHRIGRSGVDVWLTIDFASDP